MPESKPRSKDRRQVNVHARDERRGKAADRRRCPECNGPLEQSTRRVATGVVTSTTCAQCGWSRSSRQTDVDVLLAKLSWELPLSRSGAGLRTELPLELSEALKIKAGDKLLLKPLTLPVGSLPMRWSLTLKRSKA